MVGNTYPYGVSDWRTDVDKAASYGIDGFALNMGSDYWQPARIADAYTAAQQSGTGFKMFLSLDMTVMSCSSWTDASALVGLVATYATHPNQAMRNGKVLVSTFAGSDCTFGTGSADGWQHAFVDQLKSQGVDIFFVPSVFSDPSTFQSNSWMDGELNWNSAWPMSDADITTATDVQYINALGSKEYMAAISPFFFTHFGANSWNKNWLYRGDNWLYATRWEQLIAMRQQVKSLEILTWNDYGESSYIGPIHGALPAGSDAWTNGFDHESINVLTKYYSTAFKTGTYPAITEDTIVMWQRPHPHDAIASNDPAGQPTGWNWTDDNLYAVVLTTGPAQVTLTSGGNTQTFSVSGGLSKLKISAGFGGISGSVVRNGDTVASYASSGFTYTATPEKYNFNYYLGSSS
jgi:glucan endo-1,3-alpha-glucosidase